MAFKYYLSFFLLFLISSCAEVGTITGGPKDDVAPKIIKSSIQNGTTNFRSKSIQLTFDEFVQLNKPAENIFLVPQDARLESTLIRKTLKINLSNELQNNTTYTLYLNAAVKDVTEGNDSLMQFTFSTGPILDSLKFFARVADAFSSLVKSKITVGLFDSLEAQKPIYFGQSNQEGLVTLSALKEGTYFCKAFEDKNKDLQIQKDEAQDWDFEPIQIGGVYTDTIDFKISTPPQPDKIKYVKFLPPGLIAAHIPKELEIKSISLNGSELTTSQFWRPQKDSLQIAYGNQTENEFSLIINSDTFNLRRLEKNKMAKLNPKKITSDKEVTAISSFEVMDVIESIDSNKIEVLKLPDSLKVSYSLAIQQNRFTIQPEDKSFRKYVVVFKEGAINGLSGKSNSLCKIEVANKDEREFGSLNVRFNKPIEFCILQILDKENVIDEQKITSSDKPVVFSRLIPGEYTFRIIEDLNQNGQWDPISPENKQKAERIYQFSTPVKVRSNWEVETMLELK